MDSLRLSLESPQKRLRHGPLQRFITRVRSVGTGPSPTLKVELYEAGSPISIPIPNTPVTGDVVLEGVWDAIRLTDGSGVNVEALITSQRGSGGAYVEIASFQWMAQALTADTTLVGDNVSPRWDVMELATDSISLRWPVLSDFVPSVIRTFSVTSVGRSFVSSPPVEHVIPSQNRTFTIPHR